MSDTSRLVVSSEARSMVRGGCARQADIHRYGVCCSEQLNLTTANAAQGR